MNCDIPVYTKFIPEKRVSNSIRFPIKRVLLLEKSNNKSLNIPKKGFILRDKKDSSNFIICEIIQRPQIEMSNNGLLRWLNLVIKTNDHSENRCKQFFNPFFEYQTNPQPYANMKYELKVQEIVNDGECYVELWHLSGCMPISVSYNFNNKNDYFLEIELSIDSCSY